MRVNGDVSMGTCQWGRFCLTTIQYRFVIPAELSIVTIFTGKNPSPVLADWVSFPIGNIHTPAIIVLKTIMAGDYYVKTSKNSI